MKNLSGTFKLVVLAGIGVLAVLAFRAFAQSPAQGSTYHDRKFVLKIGVTAEAEVTSETDFKNALKAFGEDQYKIDFKHADGKIDHWPPGPKLSIKTERVISSELAKSAAAGELTAIGINVTQHITSSSSTDLTTILGLFK